MITADKYRINLVVPKTLSKDMRAQIIQDNYKMRGKSRWVVEAIESLLKMENFLELVEYNGEMRGFDTIETIAVSKETKERLSNAILEIRKKYPCLEGVQSCIVRTAILQRLLRS